MKLNAGQKNSGAPAPPKPFKNVKRKVVADDDLVMPDGEVHVEIDSTGKYSKRVARPPPPRRATGSTEKLCIAVAITAIALVCLAIIFLSVFASADDDDDAGLGAGMVAVPLNSSEEALSSQGDAKHVRATVCPRGQIYSDKDRACIRQVNYPNPIDPTMMNSTAAPCADFYEYACGGFARDPLNEGEDALFSPLYLQSIGIVERTIQEADENSKLGRFYDSCVRSENAPPDFEQPGSVAAYLYNLTSDRFFTKKEQLASVLAHYAWYDVGHLFSFSMELNPIHARQSIPTFVCDGLSETADNIGSVTHSKAVYERMKLLPSSAYRSDEDLRYATQSILDTEALIASKWPHSSRASSDLLDYAYEMDTKSRDVMTYARLHDIFKHTPFDLDGFLSTLVNLAEAQNVFRLPIDPRQEVWVFDEQYMRQLAQMFSSIPVATWRHYLRHALVFSLADLSPDARHPRLYYKYHKENDPNHALPWMRPPRFQATERLLLDPKARCTQVTMAYLPIVIDTYYIMESGFEPQTQAAAKEIAANVRSVIVEALRSAGHENAARKVEEIEMIIGTPDSWPISRDGLVIRKGATFCENVLSIRRYHIEIMLRTMHVGATLDAAVLYDDALYLANAYYWIQHNALIVNPGIMAPPAFSTRFGRVGQYARMGAFVGHEITHSYDPLGSMFDEEGSFRPWMTDMEMATYEGQAQCFVDAYSGRTRAGNAHDGRLTAAENIADWGGFHAAFVAAFGKKPNMHDQNTLQDMRDFFTIYAQTWCHADPDPDEERMYIADEVHSTPDMRVNEVAMRHPLFRTLFGCGDQGANMRRSLVARRASTAHDRKESCAMMNLEI